MGQGHKRHMCLCKSVLTHGAVCREKDLQDLGVNKGSVYFLSLYVSLSLSLSSKGGLRKGQPGRETGPEPSLEAFPKVRMRRAQVLVPLRLCFEHPFFG